MTLGKEKIRLTDVRISEDSKVKCQWCTATLEAKLWNENTFKQCSSREMRRAFKEIYRHSVWMKDSSFFYKCPNCGCWSRGSQLVLLDSKGEVVKGYGCEPVMKVE